MSALSQLGRHADALEIGAFANNQAEIAGEMVFCLRALGREEEALRIARERCDDSDSPYLCAVAGEEERARKLALERQGIPVLLALTRVNVFSVL
jgi:hypothetical protein